MALKTILITGCGKGGIGAALAKALHLRGHRVLATGHRADGIDPTLEVIGIKSFVLDVTSDESIQSAVSTVSKLTGGKLDVLINNAGLLQVMPFADTPVADARKIFDINVISVWAMTHAFLPLLLEARGLVVAVASINQVLCPPFLAGYNASKAAVEALMRTIRRELAPLGVRVLTVKTGSVRTKLFENSDPTVLPEGSLYMPLQDWIEKREFAKYGGYVDVDGYAEAVVKEILRDNPRALMWKGGLVWMAWLLSILGWETMLVSQSARPVPWPTQLTSPRISL